jgi:hypothetical protein
VPRHPSALTHSDDSQMLFAVLHFGHGTHGLSSGFG